MSEDVLHFDAARDEPRPILLHHPQQTLSAVIDQRHIAQINDA
jgi:hypothetical protein